MQGRSDDPASPDRRRILFGTKFDWESGFRHHLDAARFHCRFARPSGAEMEGYDAVVPLTLSDYDDLEAWRGQGGGRFLAPNEAVVRLCHDKLAFNRFLLANGFADLVAPLRVAGAGRYPYVLKRRRDEWGKNTHFVRDSTDEHRLSGLIGDESYFCQDFVPGDREYAAHILARGGIVLYHAVVAYDTSGPARITGIDFRPRPMLQPAGFPLPEAFRGILRRLSYSGTCCIDYRMVSGRPMIFEMNPRVGGSLCQDINRYLDAYLAALAPDRPALMASPACPA